VVRAEAGSLNLKVRPWKARRVNKTIYDNGGNGLLRDRAPWAVFHIRFDKRPNKPLRLRHVHRGYSCGRNVVAVSGVIDDLVGNGRRVGGRQDRLGIAEADVIVAAARHEIDGRDHGAKANVGRELDRIFPVSLAVISISLTRDEIAG
jgi:hypothetical protein